MRGSVKLAAEGDHFVLTLTTPQRVAVTYAAEVVENLQVPDLVVEVMFGAPRRTLVETGNRFDSEEPTPTTLSEVKALYQMLKTVPECYGSEEAFHIRTGYYRENFTDLAKGLINAVGKIPRPEEPR